MTPEEIQILLANPRKDLRNANLHDANLRYADLRYADLRNANLRNANLQDANLHDANLRDANLRYADLRYADLRNAYLPPAPKILLASWGQVSHELCRRLMAYDAFNHPNPGKFSLWKQTDVCPYKSCYVNRAANFFESKELWDDSLLLVKESAYSLMVSLFKEKGVQYTEYSLLD